ncbi:MAG: S-methyl-5-thioribose-1-phosphate isomerase, partial [Bacteroidales bacterium]|nr:S-methyl-5-thioribose-1-phosphate isomerase [Bacteroidales bacterium]
MKNFFPYDSVELSENARELIVLDQSLLPNQEKFLHITTAEQIFFAITLLKVRGEQAIGLAATLGLAMCMNRYRTKDLFAFEKEFFRVKRYLYISRPYAMGLMKGLDRMERCYYESRSKDVPDKELIEHIKKELIAEACAMKLENIKTCLSIAENGYSLMKPGVGVLTWSNAGHLAVSRYGTALAPIYMAHQNGYMPRIYACETRPLLQGARLTAFELRKAGVDVTLICDSMVSSLMKQGKVDMVFLGANVISANGDLVSTVGSSTVAIMAKYYNIPCYVVAATEVIDFNLTDTNTVTVEQRPEYEVTELYYEKPVAPKGVKVYNPAIDIT